MRKIALPLIFTLFSLPASFAQNLMDYVKEVKGDTLVVKTYEEMGQQANSINNVILADVSAPAGRVYELQTGGWYPLSTSIKTPSDKPTVIVGANHDILVTRDSAPPIISGYTYEGGSAIGSIIWEHDLTVKNLSINFGTPDGFSGWAFFGAGSPGRRVVFENNMMEHNFWVFIQSNAHAGSRIYLRDNYFVNMSGYACRRNGGVYDNVGNNTDTMWVENNTHIMAQGMMYKFRNYPVKFVLFNHNTFINCAGSIFETQGFLSNVIITNNIFVNSNTQPMRPNMTEDIPVIDIDQLPTGIINVAPLPGTMEQVDRKFLVWGNLIYWDPKLSNLAAEANSMAINTFTTWVNQSIKMNDRTKAMFDNGVQYPDLTEGGWYEKLPSFADSKDLLTDQVDVLKEFILGTIDTTNANTLPDWRVTSTGEGSFIYSDFPIPIDLSYSDTELRVSGTDRLPIGDLNWFPASKAIYNANKTEYINALIEELNSNIIIAVKESGGAANEFRLSQNYPNPFNPATVISYQLSVISKVELKVYDILGRELKVLVNEEQHPGIYNVEFDASDLNSGVYFYRLDAGSFTSIKKMIVVK